MKEEKEFLLNEIGGASYFRGCKHEEYPDDKRNLSSIEYLNKLHDYVNKLPEDHPIFDQFMKLNDVSSIEYLNYRLGRYGFDGEEDPETFIDEILSLYLSNKLQDRVN